MRHSDRINNPLAILLKPWHWPHALTTGLALAAVGTARAADTFSQANSWQGHPFIPASTLACVPAAQASHVPAGVSVCPPSPPPPGPAANNPWAMAPNATLAVGAPVASAPSALGNAQRAVVVSLEGSPQTDYIAKVRTSDGQTFNLVVDTGSSTTAIVSNLCQVGPSPRYNLTNAHVVPGNTSVSAHYGSGAWNGTAVFESLTLGDDTTLSLPVTIAAITQATNTFFQGSNITMWDRTTSPSIHGIMGLAYPAMVEGDTSAVASNLVGTQGFTLELCDTNGTMLFDAPPAASLTQLMRYTPVKNENYYAVEMQSLSIGGHALNISEEALSYAIIDSGTSLLTLRPEAYEAFMNSLENHPDYAAFFAMPPVFASCQLPLRNVTRAQLDAALPRFGMGFLSGSDDNATTVDQAATQSYLLPFITEKNTTCYAGGVSNLADLTPYWQELPNIIGSAPLRGIAVHYDVWNDRVGFAQGKAC